MGIQERAGGSSAAAAYSKADVNAKNDDGEKALHLAAGTGDGAVVQRLLGSKADVNAKENDGRTTLDWVAEEGHNAVMGLLKSALRL